MLQMMIVPEAELCGGSGWLSSCPAFEASPDSHSIVPFSVLLSAVLLGGLSLAAAARQALKLSPVYFFAPVAAAAAAAAASSTVAGYSFLLLRCTVPPIYFFDLVVASLLPFVIAAAAAVLLWFVCSFLHYSLVDQQVSVPAVAAAVVVPYRPPWVVAADAVLSPAAAVVVPHDTWLAADLTRIEEESAYYRCNCSRAVFVVVAAQ